MSGPADFPIADHLHARVCRAAGQVTVMLSGDLDRLTGSTLIGLVDRLRERPVRTICIDLADVDFLDLGGLRALLQAHYRGAAEGILVVVQNPRQYVRWLLEVTGSAEALLDDSQTLEAPPQGAGRGGLRERAEQADDRDRLADEREKLLDERQRRVADQQRWEDFREELADQRELDLERREHDR